MKYLKSRVKNCIHDDLVGSKNVYYNILYMYIKRPKKILKLYLSLEGRIISDLNA